MNHTIDQQSDIENLINNFKIINIENSNFNYIKLDSGADVTIGEIPTILPLINEGFNFSSQWGVARILTNYKENYNDTIDFKSYIMINFMALTSNFFSILNK